MQKRFRFSMAMESPHQIQTLGKQKKKKKPTRQGAFHCASCKANATKDITALLTLCDHCYSNVLTQRSPHPLPEWRLEISSPFKRSEDPKKSSVCHGQLQSSGMLSFPSRASSSHRHYYLREIPQLSFSSHNKYITVNDSSHALVCSGFTHLTACWSLTWVPTRQMFGRVCPTARLDSLQLSLFLPFLHWVPFDFYFLARSVTKMA